MRLGMDGKTKENAIEKRKQAQWDREKPTTMESTAVECNALGVHAP